MDPQLRAELLTLRALLLLTLAEVAGARPDADAFLAGIRNELIRALGDLRVEPEELQSVVRAHATAFAADWLGHIHFKDGDGPPPPH